MSENAWRYSINYGPEGESNYAMVYDADGALVSNLKTHHAIAVVNAMNSAAKALENSKAALADATNDPASLSSLRKGAEVAAIMEMFGRWQSGYAFNDDNDDDVDLESRVEGEIAALVSGSREDGADAP